jgi:hypothetical protein
MSLIEYIFMMWSALSEGFAYHEPCSIIIYVGCDGTAVPFGEYSTGTELTTMNEPTARCYSKKRAQIEPEGRGRWSYDSYPRGSRPHRDDTQSLAADMMRLMLPNILTSQKCIPLGSPQKTRRARWSCRWLWRETEPVHGIAMCVLEMHDDSGLVGGLGPEARCQLS